VIVYEILSYLPASYWSFRYLPFDFFLLKFFLLFNLNFLKHGLLGFSLSKKVSASCVYLLYQSVNQVNHIYDDISCHQIQEVEGKVVPGFWVAHEQALVEHEPDADQDNALVDYLDHV